MRKQSFKTNLEQAWQLDNEEAAFIGRYKSINRLHCACLLKYFQAEACFPKTFDEIPNKGLLALSVFLGIDILEISLIIPRIEAIFGIVQTYEPFLGFVH